MFTLAILLATVLFLPQDTYNWEKFKSNYPNTFERVADDYENNVRIPFIIPIYPIIELTNEQKLPIKITPIIAKTTITNEPIRGKATSYRYIFSPSTAGIIETIDEENIIFHPTTTKRTIIRFTVFAESLKTIVGQTHFIIKGQE